ncbi:ferrochelatase [Kaistia nematophila]|uniref:Ferrochelatase n=1 Tax=Kaistia nematophila TaxID=2994654 RepID=A0A9X3E5P5_9HYPH|nr:ferrochelatase [Kaistia nematophila]MCX5572295.1 ferrochelatase [Kaistia nematophila]
MNSQIADIAAPAAKPADHPPITGGRIGVLLLNLGTPDATDYWSMRRYLKEFLSDPRVIEVPKLIWWPLLNGVILTTRPQKSGKNYASIWNNERNESPLRTITRSQSEKLSAALAGNGRIVVDWGMRYGTPSIAEKIDGLQRAGCDRILIAPLYPQYSATTTATANDKAFDKLKTMRWQPAVRTLPAYHDDPVYIAALATSVERSIAALDFEPEIVLASFHGLPKRNLTLGDPYHCHCLKTARLLREQLGWPQDKLRATFQSRFGKAEWLQPYTDKTVEALAKAGVKRIAVVMPGFSADCVETLEEIAGENAEIFKHNGGEHFAALPCLNDSPEGMAVIEHIVRRELLGWV